MQQENRVIFENTRFRLTIERLCHELIENYGTFENTCLIGVQPRGIYLAERIRDRLSHILQLENLAFGKLDTTFHRDDFRRTDTLLIPKPTEMDFLVDKKRVILIDDVLYTGRTIRAALTALGHYGRPSKVELLVLIDRRFNRHLPIRADYVGHTVDTLDQAHIMVEWKELVGRDRVVLLPKKVISRQ